MRAQVREALFAILGDVTEAVVLDLFAGSGSLGLEALSRGAARAVFVDKTPVCLAALRSNVEHLGVEDRCHVRRYDLNRGVKGLLGQGPFDLVLVHPPFELLRPEVTPSQDLDVAELLRSLVETSGLLEPGARIAFETPKRCYRDPHTQLPGLEVQLRREYGSTALFVAGSGNETAGPRAG